MRVSLKSLPEQGPDKPVDRIRPFFVVPFELQRLSIEGIAALSDASRKWNSHISLPPLLVPTA